jgi:hypothetical protein
MSQSLALSAFAPDVWIADGAAVPFFTIPYPTRMALVRLREGGLFLWSPIGMTPELKAEVEALGEPKFLVSPNKLHHLFLAEWRAAYPRAKLFAPPGLRRRRPDLAFDAGLVDAADPGWAGEIDQVLFRGSFAMTEVVFYHRASRTAIFADLIQSLPRDLVKGWRGVLARLSGILEPNVGIPADWRASFFDRKAARAALASILTRDIERVVIAHGAPVQRDGEAFVRRACAWLADPGAEGKADEPVD